MASPADNLANSLVILKALQDQGKVALRASEITRTHRERLLKNGFIKEVMKGWYISTRPDEPANETTSWYASFWAFCASYLSARFGADWCLSPEQSLSLQTGNWHIPKQLLIRTPKGGNKAIGLLHGTSILDTRLPPPPAQDIDIQEGLRMYKLPAALLSCSQTQYTARPLEMRTALAMVEDASALLNPLLENGRPTIAGKIAGALRNIGRDQIADNIVATMRAAGYTVHEFDPFLDAPPTAFNPREISPYVNRMQMNWAKMREDVLKIFPAAPNVVLNPAEYLKQVEEVYTDDAYHSLSIEGYQVNATLIEKIRSGNWLPDNSQDDKQDKNALAARGYWQAFQSVKQSIQKVLNHENAGHVAKTDHVAWYRELFGPSITAGLLKPTDLAGYRNGPVYIRHAMHVPPRHEAVRDLMPALFTLLQTENEAAVRVVLGHFMFVYIHPYFDGNGRMGRFLMNLMLASGGYPWTVVPVAQRNDYMAALECASIEGNIQPFSKFLAALMSVR